jgi:hypothetical protein
MSNRHQTFLAVPGVAISTGGDAAPSAGLFSAPAMRDHMMDGHARRREGVESVGNCRP